MRIGIDISILQRGGGVANYIAQLLSGFKRTGGHHEYRLFCNGKLKNIPWRLDNSFQAFEFNIPNSILKYVSLYLRHPMIESLLGPLDVFHSPAHSPVYAYCPPAKHWVVTVHDLFTFKLNYRKDMQALERRVLKIMDKKARSVIAVSNSTRNDLIEMVPGLESRTVVIQEGVDSRFFQAEYSLSLQRQYGLKPPYILYVGAADPHKNLIRLVNVFKRLADIFPHSLVFAGRITERYQPVIERVQSLGLKDRVVFTDSVSEEDLPGIYKGADIFILPSLYEGFGLVLLEAMACGTPVAASNISSIPEVLGQAGGYFDPRNEENMFLCCHKMLTDTVATAKMGTSGKERARLFSWQKMADATLEVYRNIAST